MISTRMRKKNNVISSIQFLSWFRRDDKVNNIIYKFEYTPIENSAPYFFFSIQASNITNKKHLYKRNTYLSIYLWALSYAPPPFSV